MGKKQKRHKRLRKVLRELTALAVGVLAEYATEQLRQRQDNGEQQRDVS